MGYKQYVQFQLVSAWLNWKKNLSTLATSVWVFVDIFNQLTWHFIFIQTALRIVTHLCVSWSYQDSFCSSAPLWCWSWWLPRGSPLSYDSRFWISCDWRRQRRACRSCCRRRTHHTCPPPFLIQDSRHSRGSGRRERSVDKESQRYDEWGSHIIKKYTYDHWKVVLCTKWMHIYII